MTSNIVQYIFDVDTVRPDGLVNITALASTYKRYTGKRKDTQHWLVTKEATESIAYLERVTGIPAAELVIVEHGVGTWVHPDLAEIFAQWVSVEYRFAVIQLIRKAKESILPAPQPLPRQLPPIRDTRENIETAALIQNLEDPILKSYLLQSLYEEIGASKALPPSGDVLVVAAVKARSLGYTLSPGEDSKLGKWVAKYCNPLGKTQHGRYEVNVYRDDDLLVETIRTFFRE
jgi:hypothetical protein